MAHFAYTRPGGTWTNGVDKVSKTELEDFERKMFKAINGDEGGTWNPTSAIVLRNFGLDTYLAATKWLGFSDAGNKRTLSRVDPPTPTMRLFSALGTGSGLIQGQGLGSAFSRRIEVPHGATLTSIKARVRINNAHAGLPATNYPMMTVQRVDYATGGLTTFLKSTDAGAGVNESFVGAPVVNVAAYNALGDFEFTYTPDQNNVVDRTAYYYVVSVIDESGVNALSGNIFKGFKYTFDLSSFEVW